MGHRIILKGLSVTDTADHIETCFFLSLCV